jgi:hypothetical protein
MGRTFLNTALDYASRGWHVFPLKARGKEPATAHGIKDATTDPDQIRAWWSRNPRYNIGIATGADSGIVVLDTDNPDAEEHVTLQGDVPTLTVRTSQGRHRLYQHPGTHTPNRTGLHGVAGLDVRGDGGYIVAAPSVHPSGVVYAWENDTDLAPLPEWVTRKPEQERKQTPNTSSAPDNDAYARRAYDALIVELSQARDGTRNATLFRVARRVNEFVEAGRLPEDAFETVEMVAVRTGLTVREVTRTIASARNGGTPEDTGRPQANGHNGTREPGRNHVEPSGTNETNGTMDNLNGCYMSVSQVLAMEPPTDLLQGYLKDRAVVTVYGASGVGKSFLMLDMMASLAAQKVNALYVAAEAVYIYQARLHAWCQHHRIAPTALEGHLGFWSAAINLMSEHDITVFIELFRPRNLSVTVFDTLSPCMNGDTDSNEDMQHATRNAMRIREELGCTVVLVHHPGKDASRGPRGASVLYNDCDQMIEISIDANEIVTMSSRKNRMGADFEPRYFKLITVGLRGSDGSELLNRHGEPVTSAVPIPTHKIAHDYQSPLTAREREILDILAKPFYADGISNKDLTNELGLPDANKGRVSSMVSKLMEQSLVFRDKKEGSRALSIRLTDAGKQEVEQQNKNEAAPENAPGTMRNHLNWVVPERDQSSDKVSFVDVSAKGNNNMVPHGSGMVPGGSEPTAKLSSAPPLYKRGGRNQSPELSEDEYRTLARASDDDIYIIETEQGFVLADVNDVPIVMRAFRSADEANAAVVASRQRPPEAGFSKLEGY